MSVLLPLVKQPIENISAYELFGAQNIMSNVTEIKACLACGHDELIPTLDLGKQPLANSYKDTKDEVQEEFPLAINRCSKCFHVQLTHAVNPDLMFKDYLYVSGTSQTMKEYFKWFSQYADEYYQILNATKPTNVLDIGCNDGTQLDAFKQRAFNTYGVDPALNLYKLSSKHHTVYPEYFGFDFLTKCQKEFDIIVAQNVFAHNADPRSFLRVARNLMYDESLLFIQTSQADMILNGEFDTIYHEHINFFNVQSMLALCNTVGLYLVDVVKTPLHGNSYLFVISKNRVNSRPHNIQNIMDMENKAGLYTDQTYVKYAERCNHIVGNLKAMVNGWSSGTVHIPIVGYGAAAKGMTLLNYAQLDLDYIIDDNPMKQGKFTPGRSIPIVGPEKLIMEKKDMVILPLAWNFFDEIKGKIAAKRPDNYDRFIRYFPQVSMHEANT